MCNSHDNTRILLIDDDRKLCRLIASYLQPLGYQVIAEHHGRSGLARALSESFDAVLLDIMLPGMGGFDVLRELRRESEVPVLILTALGDEPDRIVGLEMGADDYLPKTFSTRELLARLRAVLRRSTMARLPGPQEPAAPIVIGNLRIDLECHRVTLDETPIDLTPVEHDLLVALARSAGRVRSREQLLLEAAEREFEAFDRAIDVHISSLRRKLGDDPRTPRFIETVRGYGYRMLKPPAEAVDPLVESEIA